MSSTRLGAHSLDELETRPYEFYGFVPDSAAPKILRPGSLGITYRISMEIIIYQGAAYEELV